LLTLGVAKEVKMYSRMPKFNPIINKDGRGWYTVLSQPSGVYPGF